MIKKEAEYTEAFECNAYPDRKRVYIRGDSHAHVDRIVYEWFQQNRGLNVLISGPLV